MKAHQGLGGFSCSHPRPASQQSDDTPHAAIPPSQETSEDTSSKLMDLTREGLQPPDGVKVMLLGQLTFAPATSGNV